MTSQGNAIQNPSGLGRELARCGPGEPERGTSKVSLVFYSVVSIFAFVFPLSISVSQDPDVERNIFWISMGIGSLFLAISVILILIPICAAKPVVVAFERGITWQKSESATPVAIRWEQVKSLKLCEDYDHRYAPMHINVILKADRQTIRFTDRYFGDASLVVQAMVDNVPNSEYRKFGEIVR